MISMPKAYIRIWLALLILLAVFIRVQGVSDYYYSPDEAMHTSVASGSSLMEVLRFAHYEIHPPMLYILCHYWMAFSHDPAFVRGLSLVFGILLILVYYCIGKKLNGEMTGLMCAFLIAFSNGCIIQSYVVRHYMIFLFFISLSLYCYLHWRANRKATALLGYAVFAALASLTHFSAVFSLFCIGVYEMLRMHRQKTPWRIQLQWPAINAAVALMAIYTYHLWQPTLVPLKLYFASRFAYPLPDRLVYVLLYPLTASGYILGYAAALILLLCQVWFAGTPPRFVRNAQGLHGVITLNAIAYALGMLLAVTRIYPEPGLRHSLWVLPFVIPPAGWMLADSGEWLAGTLPWKRLSGPIVTLIILATGCMTYSPEKRFSDGSEYAMPKEQWLALNASLERLGPRDLIVTEKDDGIMLTNLYPFMGDDAFTGKVMATLAPWRNTYILFNPYYPRNYSTDVFLVTLTEARNKHWFDTIDRIVFLRLAWSHSPLDSLMLCPTLEKQIVTFPPLPPQHLFTRMDIYNSYAALMTVSKQTFINDILSPSGKAHACLDRQHDMVPDLILNVADRKPFLNQRQ